MDIKELLACSLKNRASDLHIAAEMPPLIRVDGNLRAMQPQPLSQANVEKSLLAIMTERQRRELDAKLEIDFAFSIDHLSRFRVNVFYQSRGLSGVFRIIPDQIRSLDALHMPTLKKLTEYRNGLVLVTGPTGSGKSTTLAAMIDAINNREYGHILTIEDPIEFLHKSKKSLINQREVHRDSLSFENALRVALREDPDVILVGELRDLETIRLALTAAETGHLVLATLHTSSAAKTIDRIINVFPANEQAMIRTMLSESLCAVISQVLIPQAKGVGRIAAQEIMVCNTAIRHLIRENKVPQMSSVMQTNRAQGMQTLDTHLQQLLQQQLVSREHANRYLSHPPDVLSNFRLK